MSTLTALSIVELASVLHPFAGEKLVMMWGMYSDLSYDSSEIGNPRGKKTKHQPRTFVVGALLGRPDAWDSIQRCWVTVNNEFGVDRFHAAHLNGRTHEYKDWGKDRALEYSKKLLGVLNQHGPMMMFCSGVHADEYESILSKNARTKLGGPYLLCFNSCVALIAGMMDDCGFPKEDKFSALIDCDDGYLEIVQSFQQMKVNESFLHRSRLGTCAPGRMDDVPVLQTSDLVAYEWFKWFSTRGRQEGNIRQILVPLIRRHIVVERYWDRKNLLFLRDQIENTPAKAGQLVLVPPV